MLRRHLLGLTLVAAVVAPDTGPMAAFAPGPAPTLASRPMPTRAFRVTPTRAFGMTPGARPRTAPSAPVAVRYVAPLAGRLRITRGFDPPLTPYGAGHRGVDLSVAPGAVVVAAASGVVAFAGRVAGRTVVSVRHADGIRTTYEPFATVNVKRGETVSGGARLGTLATGHPGCPATEGAACLHWGALIGAGYIDPLTLLSRDDIVLLPPSAGSIGAPSVISTFGGP